MIWKPIRGFEGIYEVSDLGQVRSLDRYMPHARHGKLVFYRGKVLRDKTCKGGYKIVVLSAGHVKRTATVHRLVAEAFLPNPNNKPLVRHLNDNPADNRKKNLAWGSVSENYQDMVCWNCGAPYHQRKSRRRSA